MEAREFYYSKQQDEQRMRNHWSDKPYKCNTVNGKKFTCSAEIGFGPSAAGNWPDIEEVYVGSDYTCDYGHFKMSEQSQMESLPPHRFLNRKR